MYQWLRDIAESLKQVHDSGASNDGINGYIEENLVSELSDSDLMSELNNDDIVMNKI